MSARMIFFAAAAFAALAAAVFAGLVTAVIGLSIDMTTAAIITWIAGAAAAAFGIVIAVASFAAILFFSDSRQTPDRSGDSRQVDDAQHGRPVEPPLAPAMPRHSDGQ